MIDVTWRGLDLTVDERTPGWYGLWRDEDWEADLFRAIDRYVDDRTVVFDIGAWLGPITLYAAPRAQHVVAVEPDPDAAAILLRNVDANCSHRATVIVGAIGADDLIVLGRSGPGNSQTSTLFTPQFRSASIRLCHLLSRFGAQEDAASVFLKLDVEGAEHAIIDDELDYLIALRPTIHLSVHQSDDDERQHTRPSLMRLAAAYRYIYDRKGADVTPSTVGQTRGLASYTLAMEPL